MGETRPRKLEDDETPVKDLPSLRCSAVGELDCAFRYVQLAYVNLSFQGYDVPYTEKLRRKIDWRLLPIMLAVSTTHYLNRTVLDVSINGYSPKLLLYRPLIFTTSSKQ